MIRQIHFSTSAFQARIMRDLKKVDAQGRGLSKGYAFVTYNKHEHAIAALRAVNNNPEVFTAKQVTFTMVSRLHFITEIFIFQRPIVSFSVENKALLNARQKRLEMSQVKNPMFQGKSKQSKQNDDRPNNKFSKNKGEEKIFARDADFVGIEAHKTQTVKLPTRGTLKAQAALHRQSLMTEKKKVKKTKFAEKQKLDRKKRMMVCELYYYFLYCSLTPFFKATYV
jgi:nucleolar protein 4